MKRMQLKSSITLSDTANLWNITSKQYDGSPFTIKVSFQHFTLNEPITEEKPVVDGWLLVDHLGQQSDRAYIVLPGASIEYGKNVSVRDTDLLPADVTIQDYMKK